MSDGVFLDKDQAREGARALYNLAVNLENRIAGPANALTAFNNNVTTYAGSDRAGTEFLKNYAHPVPSQGGSQPAHTAAITAVRQYATLLKQTAGNIMVAVGALTDTDREIAAWFKRQEGGK